ncbi:hypothetical protein H6B15_03110 [Gemmiger formicilis]|uniref:hypothetical protein n=1 Tax=Gemmiger formicilis TaxID=745368 RepID=UPI001959264C|nr:hypothetical protein [Gemmiger formicilis]MBM6715650.1 hypothetical protein [Gemmiger formicilis]
MKQYKTQYGTVFAVREYKGAPAIMCRAEISETWSLSSMIAPFTPGAWTEDELQAQLENWAAVKGWKQVEDTASECLCSTCTCTGCHESCFHNCTACGNLVTQCNSYQTEGEKSLPASSEPPEIVDECSEPDCMCKTCGRESCFAHGCAKECPANAEESCLTVTCPEYIERTDTTCNCQTTAAPTGDAAATTVERAVKEQPRGVEISTTSESGADASTPLSESSSTQGPNSSPAPASRADAGAAEQGLSTAGPVSLEAKDMNVPTFDFSALGDLAGQAAEADEQFNLHYGRAQDEFLVACIYMARIHALTAKAGRYGGGTWTSWYQSKGISEGSARTMVQNGDGFKSATAADLKNLPALTKKDINLIARQGAAEQVLEAAGQGDSARIQEIMAQLKAEQTARKQAEQALAAEKQSSAGTSALLADEQQRRQQANEARIAAENRAANADARARAAEHDRDEARKERDGARDALQAVKLRGDRLKAENDDLKARPIEAAVVDEDEVNRRAEARAQEVLAAKLTEQREISARNAEDAIILLGRQINTAWQMVRPFLAEMDELQRVEAVDRINKEWAQTQKEIMSCL